MVPGFPRCAGVLVAAAVPIGVFGSAVLASMSLGYQGEIWEAAGIVSCFAIVCGTVLTSIAFARHSQELPRKPAPVAKEDVEDDAYDVVSAGAESTPTHWIGPEWQKAWSDERSSDHPFVRHHDASGTCADDHPAGPAPQKAGVASSGALRRLEMGLPVPPPQRPLGGGTVTAIGAGVPAAAVLAAWMTTTSVPQSSSDYVEIIAVAWGCAFLISACALITSLVLAILLIRSSRPVNAFTAMKPMYEPDSFDVVSSRG